MKLVLVRSCKSTWSEENRFMGWTDVPLSDGGVNMAHNLGRKLARLGIEFGIAYTSVLTRSKDTLKYILDELGTSIKPRESYKLNAKHYGALEGMNKDDARRQYGEEMVNKWRRWFAERAPEIAITDERFPGNDPKYKDVLKFELPITESQKDVYDRVVDYFTHEMSTFLKVDENVLVVAHGSTLRALTKYLEGIADEDMVDVEIPDGTIVIYDLDENLNVQNKQTVKVGEMK